MNCDGSQLIFWASCHDTYNAFLLTIYQASLAQDLAS